MRSEASDIEFLLVRIGDAERTACVESLIEHHLQGRLTPEEFERRQQAALTATNAAGLAELLVDLPRDSTGPSERPRWSRLPAARRRERSTAVDDRRRKGGTAARLLAGPAAIGLTAWLGTDGIGDAATVQVAFYASLATGAAGYLAGLLTRRRRS